MYIALIIVLATTFALLAWRDLRLALVLLAGLLPSYLLRFSIGPFPSTLLEVFIVTIIFVWILKRKTWKINLRQIDLWTRAGLLLLAAASFAVVVAPDTISAFGIWKAYFVEPFLIYLIFRWALNNPSAKGGPSSGGQQPSTTFARNIFTALAISGIILSLFAIFQYITGEGIPVPWDIERRVTGLFNYPNALGLFLAPITAANIVLSLSPLPRGSRRGSKWVWITTAALGTIAIILAQTEAAIVAVPAALVITMWFSSIARSRKFAITGIAFAIIVFALALPITRNKLLLQDYSGNVRQAQWSETMELIAANPAFGAGLNGYSEALRPYHDPKLYEIFQYPHNIILNIWSELGLLGLFAFFWLVVLVLKEVNLTLNNPSAKGGPSSGGQQPSTTFKLAAFTALATMTIHGLVDVPYFKNDLSVMTWIFIAILATSFDKEATSR